MYLALSFHVSESKLIYTSGNKTSMTVNQKLCDRSARKYVFCVSTDAPNLITFHWKDH